jgi:hypothetical protein
VVFRNRVDDGEHQTDAIEAAKAPLRVKPYEEYPSGSSHGFKLPNLFQLLPAEKSTGVYVFEVRNGMIPIALILHANKKLTVDLTGFRGD